MATRDPNKTARNRKIQEIKDQRRILLPRVFQELKSIHRGCYCNETSLNAFIGSKTFDYLNLTDDVIKSPIEYRSKWMSGLYKAFKVSKATGSNPRHTLLMGLIKGDYPNFKKYLKMFLNGSFLKHYEEHYKRKPKIDESEYWFGENDDAFGLLVTPRFVNGKWENDKSEIRHFKHPYWTLSHVMKTGLCYMHEDKKRTFTALDDYLQFFRDVLRRTKSDYQLKIADYYIDFVKKHNHPLSVPMLIPELRFDPLQKRHEYRLDFFFINPWSMEKYGFELSPWSTHGELKGKKRTRAEYNQQAKENFETEMRKHKKYWRKYGITYIIYTDDDLSDIDSIWKEMKQHIEDTQEEEQLELALLEDLE